MAREVAEEESQRLLQNHYAHYEEVKKSGQKGGIGWRHEN